METQIKITRNEYTQLYDRLKKKERNAETDCLKDFVALALLDYLRNSTTHKVIQNTIIIIGFVVLSVFIINVHSYFRIILKSFLLKKLTQEGETYLEIEEELGLLKKLPN